MRKPSGTAASGARAPRPSGPRKQKQNRKHAGRAIPYLFLLLGAGLCLLLLFLLQAPLFYQAAESGEKLRPLIATAVKPVLKPHPEASPAAKETLASLKTKKTPPAPAEKNSRSRSAAPLSPEEAKRKKQAQKLIDRSFKAWNDGELDEAIRLVKKALRVDPSDEETRKLLSRYYLARAEGRLEAKRFEEAKDDLDRAFRYWEENIGVAKALGEYYFHTNNWDRAESWLKHYIKQIRNDSEAYNLLAKIAYDTDRMTEARDFLEASLRADPNQEEVRRSLTKVKKEIKLEGDFLKSESSHFLVKYEGRRLPGVFLIVMTVCEQAYLEVGARFNYYPDRPVVVLLYTDKQFTDVTRSPEWAGAIFDGKIRIPAKGLEENELLTRMVFHEYTHVVVFQKSRGKAPVWLHEGLAQMSEGLEVPLDKAAAMLLRLGGPVPLRRLEGSFMKLSSGLAAFAYLESYLAAVYLDLSYGPYAIQNLLDLLAEGDTMDEALRLAIFKSYQAMEGEFEQWVKDQAGSR